MIKNKYIKIIMIQFGGKDSKRHFTVVMEGKEHGLYVSSTPSSAAKKAVTKLCAANKSKKVEFSIREITQGSKKKTYGPYTGYIEKLKEPIELKGRVIRYKPVAKLSAKKSVQKGGEPKKGNAAGPAPVNGNSNQELDDLGIVNIAYIIWRAPKVKENVSDFYEKIQKLEQMVSKSKIFDIVMNDGSRNNTSGEMRNSWVNIQIINPTTFTQNQKYNEELAFIINFLKYCVAQDREGSYLKRFFDFKFYLTEPREEFNTNVNELLKYLAHQIYPNRTNH